MRLDDLHWAVVVGGEGPERLRHEDLLVGVEVELGLLDDDDSVSSHRVTPSVSGGRPELTIIEEPRAGA